MQSLHAVRPNIDKVLVTESEMKSIKRFIGLDTMHDGRGGRRVRSSTKPDFNVMLEDSDGGVTQHLGYISVNNVPAQGPLRADEPVAIGTIVIDDEEWHMLFIQKSSSPRQVDLMVKNCLVSYEYDPEDLLYLTELFEDDA